MSPPLTGELIADPVHGLSPGQILELAELHMVHGYELQACDNPDAVVAINRDPRAAVTELLRLAHLGASLEAAIRDDPAGRPPIHVITAAAHRVWWPIVRSLP